jgi:hypothetical protein
MAEKKSTGAKSAPKAKAGAKSAPAKKTAKKPAGKPKAAAKKTEEVPAYALKMPNEFIAGTEDYRNLVTKGNELAGSVWNPNRVRPAIFFGLWRKVREHYKLPAGPMPHVP